MNAPKMRMLNGTWVSQQDYDAYIDRTLEETRALVEEQYEHRDRREMKACEECGHRRKVRVWFWRNTDGMLEPNWSKFCTACEHLANALKYERLAEHNRQKAREIFAKRARALQSKLLSPRKCHEKEEEA